MGDTVLVIAGTDENENGIIPVSADDSIWSVIERFLSGLIITGDE